MSKQFKQPLVEIPGVGLVTTCPVGIDGPVRQACRGILELKDWQIKSRQHHQHIPLAPVNWYQAMVIASRLGLRLLTLPEYWACYYWAKPQYKYTAAGNGKRSEQIVDPDLDWFVQRISTNTWTSTIVVWDRDDLVSRHLLDNHNYSGPLPVLIHGPEVTPDPRFETSCEEKCLGGDCVVTSRFRGYRLEGGTLVVPSFAIPEVGRDAEVFRPEDLDETTGIPKRLRSELKDRSIGICGFYCERNGLRAVEWTGIMTGGLGIYRAPHRRDDNATLRSQFFAVKV